MPTKWNVDYKIRSYFINKQGFEIHRTFDESLFGVRIRLHLYSHPLVNSIQTEEYTVKFFTEVKTKKTKDRKSEHQ